MVADKVFGEHLNAPVELAGTPTAITYLKFATASLNKDWRLADSVPVAGCSLPWAYGGKEEGRLRTFQPRLPQSS